MESVRGGYRQQLDGVEAEEVVKSSNPPAVLVMAIEIDCENVIHAPTVLLRADSVDRTIPPVPVSEDPWRSVVLVDLAKRLFCSLEKAFGMQKVF
jgi:hypothetical protein